MLFRPVCQYLTSLCWLRPCPGYDQLTYDIPLCFDFVIVCISKQKRSEPQVRIAPPHNANNIELYTFVTFSPKNWTIPPPPRYVRLEWPPYPPEEYSLLFVSHGKGRVTIGLVLVYLGAYWYGYSISQLAKLFILLVLGTVAYHCVAKILRPTSNIFKRKSRPIAHF